MDRQPLRAALAAPFDPADVKWKPQQISGSRCMAIAYITARAVMDRLDDVVGPGEWQTSYRVVGDGVTCVLSLRIDGEWVSHEDIGGESGQPDEGDRHKAAFSDALKRVAVRFGIGRYLYRLPRQWVDYDPQKRCITRAPALPDWALPRQEPAQSAQPARNGAAKRRPTLPAAQDSRPSDEGLEEGAKITPEHLAYLEGLCLSRGKGLDALAQRFEVAELAELTYGQYRLAVEGLTKLPAIAKRGV